MRRRILKFFSIISILIELSIEQKANDTWKKDALRQYYNFCGISKCMVKGINHSSTEHNPVTSICHSCSCTFDCIKRGNCCPEIEFLFPDRICENEIFYDNSMRDVNILKINQTDHKVVKECPAHTPDDLNSKCKLKRNLSEKLTTLPVTSLDSFLTYDSIYCSECNNDNYNIQSWFPDFECSEMTDFNILSSLNEIVELALENNCIILANNQNLPVQICINNPAVFISECNQTGTWFSNEDAIVNACQSLDQPIGMFRNVFCYMCNPPSGKIEIITTCLPSDSNDYSKLCNSTNLDRSMYPFKNRYCYLCNINATTEFVSDIFYSENFARIGHVYYIFSRYCTSGFMLGTYDALHVLNSTFDVEDTHPYETKANDNTDDSVSFTRQWQYTITCPSREVFSLFYNINQIKTESMSRGCTIQIEDPVSMMKCFRQTNLIRNCQNPGYDTKTYDMIENACLSFEDKNLMAYNGYYNIFCYMCNEREDLTHFFCLDRKFQELLNVGTNQCDIVPSNKYIIQSVFCRLCVVSDYSSADSLSYRSMFMLTSYDSSIQKDSDLMCLPDQLFDKRLKICRDLKCSPGKLLSNNTCIPLLRTTTGLCYIFAVGINVIVYENNIDSKGNSLLKILGSEVLDHLITKLPEAQLYQTSINVMSESSCRNLKTLFSGYIYLGLCAEGRVDRLHTEKKLLQLVDSTIKINTSNVAAEVVLKRNDNSFNLPSLVTSLQLSDVCIFQSSRFLSDDLPIHYHVNDLLLCTQVELSEKEYVKQSSDRRILLQINCYSLGPNDFLVVQDNKLRVCSEKYIQAISDIPEEPVDILMLVVRSICNIISLICLLLTFITYSLFKVLMTVPGQNNMTLVFCLILNEILFHIRLYEIKEDNTCKIIGVLQHFFILSVFTSFNICTFHIYRVFTSSFSRNLNSNFHVACKYKAYVFGLPTMIVACNIVVTYIIEESIGYGGKLCFILLRTAVIATFLFPIGGILLSNAFMFAAAIHHICNTPKVSSENQPRDKRNDVVIYFKLFAITGCSWMFQFIDAFLPKSIFSILISICNLLTGLFIFVSYIWNKRVFKLYKSLLTGKQDGGKSWKYRKDIQSKTTNESQIETGNDYQDDTNGYTSTHL
ncbi:uncharacterized protein LOC127735187 [Mytilus californianus]|uniref:uncharacterized protein LOC127735187 n=1 Tax=Mytilus californianus TaxID=6549 RepID=UPI0022486EB6|nr:uncharacterized protein LOC127735187 [Mytilus californianus]